MSHFGDMHYARCRRIYTTFIIYWFISKLSDAINSGGFTENAYVFVCLNTTVESAQKKQKSAAERQQEEKQDRKNRNCRNEKAPQT